MGWAVATPSMECTGESYGISTEAAITVAGAVAALGTAPLSSGHATCYNA